jgi:uncharacterized protein involved in exopolysaccharide biosynthesis
MREKEDEISLLDIYLKLRDTIRFLWTRKISIVIAGALGGAIGLTYAFLKPVEYEAKLTFVVEQNGASKGLGALSGIASSFGLGGLGGEGGLYDNQANLNTYLKSRSVIEESYLSNIPGTNMTFAEKFAREYGWREEWSEDSDLSKIRLSSGLGRDQFTIQEDSVLFEIYKYTIEEGLINVSLPDEEGSIVSISFKTLDDTLSKFFPEVLLSVVTKNYTETKTRQARENVALLQRQTDSVRAELNASLVGLATSTDQILGLNPGFNVKRVPATKQQIDVQASTVLMGELIKNLELAKVQLKDQTPLIEVIDKPIFPLERDESGRIKHMLIFGLIFGMFFIMFLLMSKFFNKLKGEVNNSENGSK